MKHWSDMLAETSIQKEVLVTNIFHEFCLG